MHHTFQSYFYKIKLSICYSSLDLFLQVIEIMLIDIRCKPPYRQQHCNNLQPVHLFMVKHYCQDRCNRDP
ncbi:hypothetical protein Hanom_Chr01g00048321 [Helianthus anomalus]